MSLADGVSFFAASSGTGPFVFSGSRPSFRTPAQAKADGALFDGGTYSYLAQDSLVSPTQREWGHAVFTALTNTFTRTPLGGIDNGVDTATSPVPFKIAPLVSLSLLAEDVRQILTSNTTFYVSTTGSDSNPGTLAQPWATPQHAANFLATNIDAGGFVPIVQIMTGTYAGPQLNGVPVQTPLQLWLGDYTTPTNVNLTTSQSGYACFDISAQGVQLEIDGLTFKPNAPDLPAISFDADNCTVFANRINGVADAGGSLALIDFENAFCFCVIGFSAASFLNVPVTSDGRVSLTGTWDQLIYLNAINCEMQSNHIALTLVSTPVFNNACVNFAAPECAMLGNFASTTGSATGLKLLATTPGIFVGNPTLLPGTGLSITSQMFMDATSIYALQKSGLPSTSDLAAGTWGVFKDTSGGGVYVAYNDSGTIKKVALT